jgi:N6-L-threonylcarbamoyladenine synthase
MPLLAIETTCDETAAAVITRDREVRSSVVASQEALHARWRGVVPEIASRAHVERIIPVIDEAVRRAGIGRDDLEAVAVAVTPGLVGSLLVGLSAAKAIAATLAIPIVGYDHVAAHLYACRLGLAHAGAAPPPQEAPPLAHASPDAGADRAPTHPGAPLPVPLLGLVASGGHTSLFLVRSPLDLERLGGTIDDAAGEAFDKAAALLGLGYPGGPEIERCAAAGDPRAHRLPRPLVTDRDRLDLSFSGLKTALRYLVRPPGAPADVTVPEGQARADLAASFQQAVVDCIVAKLTAALDRTPCRAIAIGGGVAANGALRAAVERLGGDRGLPVLIPPRWLCTDNAAMGAIAWERLERGDHDDLDLDVTAGTDRSASRRRP